jgi:thioredoxin reductase
MTEGNTASSLYDVAILGGGPAGLSAALLLGRALRQTLLFDHGRQRNRSAKAIHGFLSQDGIAPADFLAKCRRDLEQYGAIKTINREVASCRRSQGGHFEVLTTSSDLFEARFLLVASGVEDALPQIEGLENFYGRSVHHCPYCDGWEHRSRPVGVYGSDAEALSMAQELTLWSDDVTLYGASPRQSLPRARAWHVQRGKIVRLLGQDGALTHVCLENGEAHKCEALFFPPDTTPRLAFLSPLRCPVDGSGHLVTAYDGRCKVEGVFAAGNTSGGLQMAIEAAAQGSRAAHTIIQMILDRKIDSGKMAAHPEAKKPR